jgi:hypothetical protein
VFGVNTEAIGGLSKGGSAESDFGQVAVGSE